VKKPSVVLNEYEDYKVCVRGRGRRDIFNSPYLFIGVVILNRMRNDIRTTIF
jgi:hypothetical protein